MAEQRSLPPREFADKRADVLSDSTDLDTLLAAILGDERAPASVEPRPQPTLVALSRAATEPDKNNGRSAAADDDPDAEWADNIKGFLTGLRQPDIQAADPLDAVAASTPLAANADSLNWRDRVPVPTSKQSLLIAGLSAAALITLSVSSFRDNQNDGVVPASPASEVPAPAPAPAPSVEPPVAAPAPIPAEFDVTVPSRETTTKPRVSTPPSPRPVNGRTTPPQSEVQPLDPPSPAPAPVRTSPIVLQRVADEVDRVPAPTRTTIPDSEPSRPAANAPAPAPAAPTVATGAASAAPPSVSTVPAAVARRTPPRLLEGGAPDYPAALRTARVGGIVEVRFTIDASGRVTNVQSVTGPPQLRPAAEAAVRRWRYEPARLGNAAVDTQTSVNFNFDPSTSRRPQQD